MNIIFGTALYFVCCPHEISLVVFFLTSTPSTHFHSIYWQSGWTPPPVPSNLPPDLEHARARSLHPLLHDSPTCLRLDFALWFSTPDLLGAPLEAWCSSPSSHLPWCVSLFSSGESAWCSTGTFCVNEHSICVERIRSCLCMCEWAYYLSMWCT